MSVHTSQTTHYKKYLVKCTIKKTKTCNVKLWTVFHCVWSSNLQLTQLTGYYNSSSLKIVIIIITNILFTFYSATFLKAKEMLNRSLVNYLTSW